jgi:P27 family predicted phage terminase small subunit
MARGRKPLPTHLKLIQGNPGKRALNKDEPQPDLSIPTPPPHLNDEAKVEWGRVIDNLYRLALVSEIDRAALAAYCQAYGRWVQAERALARMAEKDQLTHALMIKTTNGNAIQNPLVGTANHAMNEMMRFAGEFGMTPSARSRINVGNIGAPSGQEEKKGLASFRS